MGAELAGRPNGSGEVDEKSRSCTDPGDALVAQNRPPLRTPSPVPSGPPIAGRKKRSRRNIMLATMAIAISLSFIAAFYLGAIPGINRPAIWSPINETPTTPSAYDRTVAAVDGISTVKNIDGAVTYSSRDATSAIQTALNSLTSGRTVKQAVLLQGDFVITKAISIPSYTILQLDGKVTWGSSAVGYMLTATDKNNFEVRGGEWNGNKGIRSTTSSSNPMNFERCQDVLISNLKVHDGPYDNIEFEYGERITISGVESYNSNWDSFMMAFCNNCVVENCHIHDIAQGGCYFYCEADGIAQTINNNIMRNNLVERTLTSGLSLSPRGAEDKVIGGLIEGNTLIDCGTDGDHPAINTGFAVNGQGTIIRNNVISCPAGLSGAGIEFGVDNGQCTGNTISGTGESGISCTGSGNTITGNTIRSCGSQGYSALYNGGSNNVVSGNTIA